jgi:hypothetical protein
MKAMLTVLMCGAVACSSADGSQADPQVDQAVDLKVDSGSPMPKGCTLDQGQPTSDQIYVCTGGLYLCSSPVDGGAPPKSGCTHPSPTVVVKGVEWDTWCCN